MVDITFKNFSLRSATAQAIVRVSSAETIRAIEENKVPKGNVFEIARAAGLFAAKKTSDLIPDCHPIPVEYAGISYKIQDLDIYITVEIRTVYKTGVEVEAMHAASVVALTFYDMLKPLDKSISIEQIRLIEKKGGKADFKPRLPEELKSVVIVCSDTASRDPGSDRSGKLIAEKLSSLGLAVADLKIVPDDPEIIRSTVAGYCRSGADLVILTGGTGLSPRDQTPEAIESLITRRIPGVEEAIRAYGQQRTPYAMLSRSMVGMAGNTLLMALPGSTGGVTDGLQAVFPQLLHLFRILKGERHEENQGSS
jgi:molybdenum cofactor biosynthesis protein MoaC